MGPHRSPLLPRTHLPLLKYWYLGDEESGRKSRPIGSMLVPQPGAPPGVSPSSQCHTCSLSPRPTGPAIRPPSPAGMSLWEGLVLSTCLTRYSPVSIPPCPSPHPCVPGHSPSRLGENRNSLSFLHGSGARAEKGLGGGPRGSWGSGAHSPPGGALRIRTGVCMQSCFLLLEQNPRPHFIIQNFCRYKLMKYKLRVHTEADKREQHTVI